MTLLFQKQWSYQYLPLTLFLSTSLKDSFVVYLQPQENLSDYYLVLFRFNYLLQYAFFKVLGMMHLLNQTLTGQPNGYYQRTVESYRYLFIKVYQDLVNLNKIMISLFQHLNLKYLIQIDFLLKHSIISVNLFNVKGTIEPVPMQRHSFTIVFQKLQHW